MADNEKTLERGQAQVRARDTSPDSLTVTATDTVVSTESRAFLRISAACPTQENRDAQPGPDTDTKQSRQFFAIRNTVDTLDEDFAEYPSASTAPSTVAASGYKDVSRPDSVDPELWLLASEGISGTGNEVDTWSTRSTSVLAFTEGGTGKPLVIDSRVDMNNASVQENYFLCGDVNTFKDITETGIFSFGWRGAFDEYDAPVFTIDASLLHTRTSTGRGANLFIYGAGANLGFVTWNGASGITHRCDWTGFGAYYSLRSSVDIVVIGDGVNMRMYVDGVEVGTTGTIVTDAGPHLVVANFGKLNNGNLYHIGKIEGVWYDSTATYGFTEVGDIREFLKVKSQIEDLTMFAGGDLSLQANVESDPDATLLPTIQNRALGLTSYRVKQPTSVNQATLETEFLPYGNSVYAFSGNDFYRILNSDLAPVIPATGDFTLQAVVSLNSLVGTQAIFAQWITEANSGSLLLSYQSGFRVDLTSDGTQPDENLLTTTAIVTGEVCQVVLTREGDTFSLYLNGVLEDSVTDVGTRRIGQYGTLIGANSTSGSAFDGIPGNFLDGQIASLAFNGFEVQSSEDFIFQFESLYGQGVEVRVLNDPLIVNFVDVRVAPWLTTASNMTRVGELTGRSVPTQLSTSTFYRPTYTENVFNGFPMMAFDGSGDYFEWSGISDVVGEQGGAYTATAFLQPTGTSGVRYIFSFNTSTGGNRVLVGYNGTSDRFEVFDGFDTTTYASTNTFAPNEFYVVTVRHSGASQEIEVFVDGELEIQQTLNSTVISSDRYLLGAELDSTSPSDHFPGFIGFHAVAASSRPFYKDYFESYIYGTYYNPEDIPDAFAVFEADTPGTAYVNTDPVTAWTDLTLNTNDAAQLVGAAQPTYVTDALNGLPALSFDGGDSLVIPAAISNGVGDALTVVAFAENSSGLSGTLVTTEENLNEGFSLGYNGSNSLLYEHANQTPILTRPFGKITPEVVGARRSVNDADVERNAKFPGDTTLTGFTPATDLNTRIGNSTQQPGFDGSLYELALYSRSLREAEARGIAYGYNVKYGRYLRSKPVVNNEVFEFDILQETGYVEGDPVPTMTDQTGTADATQGTVSLQAEYRATLVAGLPTLYFDATSVYNSPTVPALGADPRTVFWVGCPYKGGAADGIPWSYGPNTGGEDFLIFIQNATGGFTDVWQFSNNVVASTQVFSPSWAMEVIAVTYDGTELKIYQNGVLRTQETFLLNTASQGITIGDQDGGGTTANRYTGWMSYLQFRNEAMSEDRIKTYTDYLARKYRLPL